MMNVCKNLASPCRLELRRLHLDLIFCYKIVFGLVCVNFNDFFEFSPTLTTRGHAYKLFKPRCTSGVRQNFYTERVINLWNSLPPTVSFTVPERVKYKLVTMVYNCLHGKAPSYLTDCCTPISDVASRRHLRSASRRQLFVPRHNLSTYGRRAFSVAGPAAWNCLSDELCEPLLTANSFRQLLKTRLFAEYKCIQRIRGIAHYALYKSTYLLTSLSF